MMEAGSIFFYIVIDPVMACIKMSPQSLIQSWMGLDLEHVVLGLRVHDY